MKRFGEQPVAGQESHAFTEHLMRRGPTAAQIIVVHGRQIVMDQGIGMDHFDGASKRQQLFSFSAEDFSRGQRKYRPYAFSAREQAIAHGLPKRLRTA